MCEHSNVSSAAALREARRRKILENSANRLRLIEGINSSHVKSPPETFLEPKPEPEVKTTHSLFKNIPDSKLNSKLNDFIKTNKELKEISDFLLKDNNEVLEDEDEREGEEEVEVGTIEPKRGNAFFQIFLQKRLHYVLLALTANLLFFLNAGYLFYENIFCPFYSLKIIELVSRKQEKDFQPMLSLVVAGLPKKVQKITRIILILLQTLLSDLCIYLFTFMIGAQIINKEH